MANNRLYFAVEQVGFATLGATSYTAAHGVQSFGLTTTFNLEQVFELGQLAIYDNIENIPDIECTLEKVLDGYPLLYHLATQGAATADIAGRSTPKCMIGASFFPDNLVSSSGTPNTQIQMSGMVVSSVGYQFPVDGNFTESCTLVGQEKVWKISGFTFNGAFVSNNDVPASIAGSGGVNRRQHMLFTPTTSGGNADVNGQLNDSNCTILPRNIPGISTSGTNNRDADGYYLAKVQNVSVNCDLGREQILNLGARSPYFRYVTFPVQVGCDIEVLSLSGDLVSATEAGVFSGSNLQAQSIRIAVKEGTRINLGTQNKLQSVSVGGGSTGGENQTLTFSYQTFNDLTVTHWNDPTVSLRVNQGGVDN